MSRIDTCPKRLILGSVDHFTGRVIIIFPEEGIAKIGVRETVMTDEPWTKLGVADKSQANSYYQDKKFYSRMILVRMSSGFGQTDQIGLRQSIFRRLESRNHLILKD